METETTTATTAKSGQQQSLLFKNSNNVMAPSNISPSVSIALHPLVIINISEHWTRIKAQQGESTQVYGALLGRHKGRNIELCTSFEMKMGDEEHTSNSGTANIDIEFLNTLIGQFKQVFADLDFLGWYTTGGQPTERDIQLHKQICSSINESPVLLKLDPFGNQSDLPIFVFESVIDVNSKGTSTDNTKSFNNTDSAATGSEVRMLFIELEYTLATEEAERIGVDHIAKHSAGQASVKSALTDHLNAQYSAISLLHSRIQVIYEYVKQVKEDTITKKDCSDSSSNSGRVKLKKNNEILREIQSLCQRLPVMNSPNFHKEFYTLYNDVTWISYLGVIMQGSNTLNQYLKKFLLMHDKTIAKRGGRSLII